MLNKEQSKEYEKYLTKKKAELLKYLRRQAVNLGKFTSMDEYLCLWISCKTSNLYHVG